MDRRQSSAAKGLTKDEDRTIKSVAATFLAKCGRVEHAALWQVYRGVNYGVWPCSEKFHGCPLPPPLSLNFFSSSSFILFSKWLIERKRLLTFLWLLFLIGHYNNLLVVELVSDFNVRLLDAFIIWLFFLPCYGFARVDYRHTRGL